MFSLLGEGATANISAGCVENAYMNKYSSVAANFRFYKGVSNPSLDYCSEDI